MEQKIFAILNALSSYNYKDCVCTHQKDLFPLFSQLTDNELRSILLYAVPFFKDSCGCGHAHQGELFPLFSQVPAEILAEIPPFNLKEKCPCIENDTLRFAIQDAFNGEIEIQQLVKFCCLQCTP